MQREEAQESTTVHNLGVTVDDYLADCRARGLSLKTVEDNYRYALKQVLLPWLAAQRIDSLAEIDTRLLMRWQSDLLTLPGKRGRPVSRYSIEGWVKSVNSFLRWAKAQGEMAHEAHGRAPRPPRVLIDVLSRDEIDRMERTAQTERDKLIIRLFADTGIRAGELLGLRTTDLVERDRATYLRVRGKGAKERLVPIPRLAPRLKRYIRGDMTGRIFLTLRRRGGQRGPLTLSGLQKLVRALAREAGLAKRVHPHLFRHSYATWALSRGMNPIQLADILGHSSLVMIQRNYAHLSSSDAYAASVRLFQED